MSFLIATRNRAETLPRCLESVGEQTYPHETIVVDDGSTDGTGDVVREVFPDVRLVRLDAPSGIGRALAAGAREATGEILVNIDDDAFFESPKAAETIARHFARDRELDVLAFRVRAPDGSTRRREIPRRDKRLPEREVPLGYFMGGAVAYRRGALAAAGGYAEDIGYASEDLDAAMRLFRRGARMLYTPEVVVIHTAVPSPENTRTRQASYLRSRMRIAARYLPAPYSWSHATLWTARSLLLSLREGTFGPTFAALADAARDWRRLRADRSERLTLRQAHALSRLSGRTWY